jgi:hypothetical protein
MSWICYDKVWKDQLWIRRFLANARNDSALGGNNGNCGGSPLRTATISPKIKYELSFRM